MTISPIIFSVDDIEFVVQKPCFFWKWCVWAQRSFQNSLFKFVTRDFQSLQKFFDGFKKLNSNNLLCSETSKELFARYFVTVRHLDRSICLENDTLVIFCIWKHKKVQIKGDIFEFCESENVPNSMSSTEKIMGDIVKRFVL